MKAALFAAVDGIAFTWRLGTALVRAAIGGVVGMAAGFVVFALLGLLVPKEWGGLVWNGGIILSGVLGTGFAFLGAFHRPAPPDTMGSAAWAAPRMVAAELATPALARDPAALLVGRAYGRRGEPLRYVGPAHLLTAPRPVICVDPKGENARIAARGDGVERRPAQLGDNGKVGHRIGRLWLLQMPRASRHDAAAASQNRPRYPSSSSTAPSRPTASGASAAASSAGQSSGGLPPASIAANTA